jgi:TolB-like protein/Flp pilus assembly protein TadD
MYALNGFWSELKRRKVARVAVVYAATAFVVLQAADIMLPRLAVPEWAMTLVVVFAVLGFPIALVLGWALELTPDGIRRTETAPEGQAAEGAATALLGKRTLIVAGALVMLGIGLSAGWLLKQGGPDAPAAVVAERPAAGVAPLGRSIAVLPFENFSTESGNDYFGDGLADTLLHKLAQIKDLKVIARNSSFQFRGGQQDLRQVGEILGVETVLEGSFQRAGNQVRIIAQLVRTSDGAHVWSRTFDGTMDDIFDLQDRVTDSIVNAFQFTLSNAERERLRRDGTIDPVAYDLVIRAINLRYTVDDRRRARPEGFEKLQLLREAIARDPGYVQAWEALSESWSGLAFAADSSQDRERFVAESEAAAREALRLAPGLPGPHAKMGWVAHRKDDRLEAARHFRRALELDPNFLNAISGLALQVGWDDPEAALALLDRAVELDPASAFGQRQRHFMLRALGRIDEAIAALDRAIVLAPDESLFYGDLTDLAAVRGRPDEGARVVSTLLRRSPESPTGRVYMASVWTLAADFGRSGQWLALERRSGEFSDHAEHMEAQRLVASGRYSDALDQLAEISGYDDGRYGGWYGPGTLGVVACLALERPSCAREAFDRHREWLAGRALRGSGSVADAVFSDLLEVLVKEAEGRAPEDIATRQEFKAILEGLEPLSLQYAGVHYGRAGVLARMGAVEQALALLEEADGGADGAVQNLDPYGLSISDSLLLAPLRDTPGFAAWLARYEARRDAMLARMRVMESRGEILQPATVERMVPR